MKTNDIIDIVWHDERGHMTMRRAVVKKVSRVCGRYSVRVENLRGKNRSTYDLPLKPIDDVRAPDLIDCVNWAPFVYHPEEVEA